MRAFVTTILGTVGGLSAAVTVGALAATSQTIAITRIDPRAYRDASKPAPLNVSNGTLNFKTATKPGNTIYSLVSYGTGNTYQRDCTELVKRYAFYLGFYGPAPFKNDTAEPLKDLGDGKSIAQGFAKLSNGLFVYYPSGSTVLPKAGSVISIDYFKGATTGQTITGHAGILDSYSVSNSVNSFSVRLFDQNSPGDYKNLTFTSFSGKWTATWPNGGKNIPIVGWASPKN